MKMRIFDRILLSVYTLVIIVFSFVLFAVGWRLIPEGLVTLWIGSAYSQWGISVSIVLASLAFFIISLKLLFSGVRKSSPKSTLLKNTEFGIIRISLDTIDGLAQKSSRSLSGIRDVKSSVVPNHDGVRIFLKVSVVHNADIPQTTTQLQKDVKEYIEKLSGIYVKEVQVYVDNPPANNKIKVD